MAGILNGLTDDTSAQSNSATPADGTDPLPQTDPMFPDEETGPDGPKGGGDTSSDDGGANAGFSTSDGQLDGFSAG